VLAFLLASPPRSLGANDGSGPLGTWYLTANHFHLTVTIATGTQLDSYLGAILHEDGSSEPLDHIRWDNTTRRLEFRRNGSGFWQWYRCYVVEGILRGRFSHSEESSIPTQLTSFTFHVSGWNSTYLDQAIVPRVYEVLLNSKYYGRLRIDTSSSRLNLLAGRLKIYAASDVGAAAEEPEYDLQMLRWDGTNLEFIRRGAGWTQTYTGRAAGRTISGTFTQNDVQGRFPWSGYRAEVLTYGFGRRKARVIRVAWQERTRRQLCHLMMAGNPAPLSHSITVLRSDIPPLPSLALPSERDDNPLRWAQNYRLTELQFDYTLPNSYSGQPIVRRSHGYLAVPTAPPPQAGKYPAALALNGHSGSAWKLMNPDEPYHWYGDSFARRGFVVLAMDISHRPVSDRRAPYMAAPLYDDTLEGDDPDHGNTAHPSIKASGFDSDWEEDGERAWDAMRGLDYLLSPPSVDATRVLVTGISLGGEVTMIAGALDPRSQMSIPAGFSPDLGVMTYHGNHPCWQWMHADIREYVDPSDFYALTAPRPLIIETGKADFTFSQLHEPFAGDKQVSRRVRAAYGSEAYSFVHYLHYDEHHFHVGDVNPTYMSESDVRLPVVIKPESLWSLAWQTDSQTFEPAGSLLDYVAVFLGLK
jgi:dienelactone hydrolase